MENEQSFEKALARLEELVGLMESDKTPLEKLVEYYEEGVSLSRYCQQVLKGTEKKIAQLTKNLSDEPKVADIDEELPF